MRTTREWIKIARAFERYEATGHRDDRRVWGGLCYALDYQKMGSRMRLELRSANPNGTDFWWPFPAGNRYAGERAFLAYLLAETAENIA